MSRTAIDRAAWDPTERAEYEALLAEVCAASRDTSERLDLFEKKILDAIQAHRPWANDVSRACVRFGLGKEIARHEDRQRALISYDGKVLSLPSIQARRIEVNGEVSYQRELIVLWTWEEIQEKREEALQSKRTYTAKIQHYDRLLSLRVLAPNANSPAEAADIAGIDLDEYLGAAA